MWEIGNRGWVSVTVGVAAGGVAGQGAPGRDNEHKGLVGWNFAGLDWYFIAGLIFGLDFIVDKFGIYAAPVIMFGSNSVIPGIGFGVALFRLGLIVPIWTLGVIVPAIIAVIGSAAIGVILLIGIGALIFALARRVRRRTNQDPFS